MKDNFADIKNDLKHLHSQGVNLLNAMRDEQFPAKMEEHFTNVLKKNYEEFKKGLPTFKSAYQPWYSEAAAVVKILLPIRYNDSCACTKNRKIGRKLRETIMLLKTT